MKKFLPQFVLLLSVFFVAMNGGCQRSLLNQQRPITEFLAKSDDSVEMLFGIGRLAERNGKTEKALEAYHSILVEHVNHANAMHRIGVIKAKQGLIAESIDWMEKASQVEIPSAELLGDMGYVLYLNGDFPAAKLMLENGLRKKPNDARMTNNLAIVAGAMEQYNESMNLFRQHGTEAEALAAIAYLQVQGGQVAKAKQNYLRSLELDGKLEIAANGLIELDRNASNSDAFQNEPIEIEMPSSVQLATYHERLPQDESENEVSADVVAKVVPVDADVATEVQVSGVLRPKAPPILKAKTEGERKPIQQPDVASPVKGRLRGPAKTVVGEESRFQLFVENTSSDSVQNIEAVIVLDASMDFASVSHEAWFNEAENSVTWSIDSLAAGNIETIDFDAVSNVVGAQTHRLTIKVNGQPVGELRLDTKAE